MQTSWLATKMLPDLCTMVLGKMYLAVFPIMKHENDINTLVFVVKCLVALHSCFAIK